MGYPPWPGQDAGVPWPGMGFPQPGQDNRWNAQYAASGMPLAFTQEDFLLVLIVSHNLIFCCIYTLFQHKMNEIYSAEHQLSIIIKSCELCETASCICIILINLYLHRINFQLLLWLSDSEITTTSMISIYWESHNTLQEVQ